MKKFMSSTGGKITVAIVTVAVIVAVVIVAMMSNKGYRTIAVEALNGTTSVVSKGDMSQAYVGQHLKSGDEVRVSGKSDLTLMLDSDKYVFAKENTHFWVEAVGKANDTRTDIKLDEGSVLSRIDNKLAASESYNVDTPNSTMSVRGTVFKVECDKNGNDLYTIIDVYEGSVFVQVKMENGQNTEESRLLNAGERAVVRSNSDESAFLTESEIYEVGDIDYHMLTQTEALFLGDAIDAGRTLSVEKEVLYDIAGLIEHDFSMEGRKVEPTCEEDGFYTEICSICGLESEQHAGDKKLGHDFVASKDNENEKICSRCGKTVEEVQEDNPDECVDHDNETIVVKSATCTAEGLEEIICKKCQYKSSSKTIPALGHNYVTTVKEASCTEDGAESIICSNCGDGTVNVIKTKGHNMLPEYTTPTCTTEGSDAKVCSKCGHKEEAILPATGHSGSYVDGGSGHYLRCNNCGQDLSGMQSHTIDNTTGACSVCGHRL